MTFAMGAEPKVNCVVKHTFLEVVGGDGERPAEQPLRGRSLTDTSLYEGPAPLASTPLKQPAASPRLPAYSPHALPRRSPLRPPAASPQRLPAWPETPLLEAAFEHQALPKDSLMGDAAWMLPASVGMGEGMDHDWMAMMMPYSDVDYAAMAEMVQCWPVDPSSASTASGEEATASGGSTGETGDAQLKDWRTTVMLRGLPADLTRDLLVTMLNEQGFVGYYDLVYLPVDFSTGVGLGYAFVNCTSPALVQHIWAAFDGRTEWPIEGGDKACSVSWSDPHQGLAAHIERYQNSPVMHPEVPDPWKPALYVHGMRVDFPPPTKRIKAPKVRSKKAADAKA